MTSAQRRTLYRLPWSLHDNPIAWVEITDVCNLVCAGCYRRTQAGHKSFAQVREEIDQMCAWRNPDNVSLSGGEPLLHPALLDIVAHVRARGVKPILLTNGLLLDAARVAALKQAGLTGFTLHVDSTQARPGWESADEEALNALRLELAHRIAAARGLTAVFNATVTAVTVAGVPAMLRWATQHSDSVHGMVFITHRDVSLCDYGSRDGRGAHVAAQALGYVRSTPVAPHVVADDIHRAIRRVLPAYRPACFLGGTATHTSAKWQAGVLLVAGRRVLGCVGRRTIELAQVVHHFMRGRYAAYFPRTRVSVLALLLALVDPVFRRTARAWLGWLLRGPWRCLARVRVLTVGVIQAPDILADGRVDMCDACPDMTWHNGQLVNSCRLDEQRLFGALLTPTHRRAAGDGCA
jgi:hypothetical protein